MLMIAPAVLAKPVLEYRVEGLERSLRKNVEAWLGPAPETDSARAGFMASVQQRVEQSLQALGYFSPQIDLDLKQDRIPWKLAISVQAGEPVIISSLDVQIEGDAGSDEAFVAWRQNLPLKQGDILHQGHYESLKRSLYSLAQQRGYFDGEFSQSRVAVEVQARSAQVKLYYDSGRRYHFGPVRDDGQHLYAERLLPLQPFREGDPFELSKLQEFQSQLQRTGYFSGAMLRPRLDEAKEGAVPLDMELFPAKHHSFEVGVGYSTDTRERVSLVWRTPLINRYGHSQETRIEWSAVNPSGRFTYNIPISHPLDDVLQLRARLEQNEFGDIDSDQTEAGLRREIRRERWIYGYGVRYLSERWELNGPTQENRYLLPGFSLSHKRRQGPLTNPDSGFSQYYEVEGGSDQAGSDIDLVRLYTKLAYVTTLLNEQHRFVGRLEAGAVFVSDADRNALAPSLSFFAGGSQSLRGYGYQSIGREVDVLRSDGKVQSLTVGGDRLLVGSLEYQYQFKPDWRAALFVDAGDAFDDEHFDTKIGVGVGLHYLTPVGAIKLEVASDVSEDDPGWRVHINIGTEF